MRHESWDRKIMISSSNIERYSRLIKQSMTAGVLNEQLTIEWKGWINIDLNNPKILPIG